MPKKNQPAAHSHPQRAQSKQGAARNKSNSSSAQQGAAAGTSTTMKDLLKADALAKLQAHADQLKAAAADKLEADRQQREAARQAEQKRLDNDFAHLLNNSGEDWRKYK